MTRDGDDCWSIEALRDVNSFAASIAKEEFNGVGAVVPDLNNKGGRPARNLSVCCAVSQSGRAICERDRRQNRHELPRLQLPPCVSTENGYRASGRRRARPRREGSKTGQITAIQAKLSPVRSLRIVQRRHRERSFDASRTVAHDSAET
jgi:hypothetical protein